MKNKGFTLIELLAVIVILAIIALIAVPIILNIVGSSKKSAVVRSGELYLKAVETAIARENLNNQLNPKTCIIGNDGNLTCDEDKTLTIQVNGSKPTSGTITLEKGKIKEVADMILDGFELEKKPGERLKIKGTSTEPVTPPTPVEPENPEYSDNTGAEVDLPAGLTPVVYSDNNWVIANTKEQWYNYETQEWANAVILNAGVTKNVGDTIDVSSEIKGMFVYVPRYEYKIEGTYGKGGTSATEPGEIEVNFISKETTTASEGYRIHPAFTFGITELSGIWVGKFETTGSVSEPTILPNVASLVSQTVSEEFATAQIFNTYINNSSIDVHMAKNSEWGATAYLSQSKYGKYGNSNYTGINKEIYQNKSTSPYITGRSSGEPGEEYNAGCIYNNVTDRGNGRGACGAGASTTGNITGVYDMNGGAYEYVMGVLNKSVSDSGFTSNTLPEDKYYDEYTSTTAETACSSGVCYGHALSETAGWYSDSAVISSLSGPWFRRGGNSFNVSSSGIFNFGTNNGSAKSNYSFRVALVEA